MGNDGLVWVVGMRKGDLALGHGEEEGRPRLGHWRGCLAWPTGPGGSGLSYAED